MSHPNDQAFPGNGTGTGLTKREYFAIKAFAELAEYYGPHEAVNMAVASADKLLKALSK